MIKHSQPSSDKAVSLKREDAAKAFTLTHNPSLDGIRGVSILLVLAFNAHFASFRGGYIGVDIFFVLSGLLITSLLIQEFRQTSEISLKNFYYRRALRLLPALLALSGFCAVYAVVFQPREKAIMTGKGILYTLFYVANWAQTGRPDSGIGALSHAWSLSVEEQFYICWPLLLILVLHLNWQRRRIAALLIFLSSVSIAWSAWMWYSGSHYLRLYLGSDTRAYELFIGCLAGLCLHWGIIPQTKAAQKAFGLVSAISIVAISYAVITMPVDSGYLYCGGLALIALGTAVVLINVSLFPSRLNRFLEFPPLVWIGKISYGLYLWHYPAFEASRQMLAGRINGILYELLRFGAVFILATASYYFVEKPFLKLKQRFRETKSLQSSGISEPSYKVRPTPVAGGAGT
jgi:peptidoglycan/LPS O-acetylase OafA/YrhL